MLLTIIFNYNIIKNWNKNHKPIVTDISQLTYKAAFIIGVFQLIVALFPGTSRSGATIVGALLIGIARPVAAEFTFYLAVPTMFGASLLKIVKYAFLIHASAFFLQKSLIVRTLRGPVSPSTMLDIGECTG